MMPESDVGSRTNLLVIDTSTERAVIALATTSGVLYATATETTRRHGRDLIPRIGCLLGEAGLRVADLNAVAVGLGPGSYTGLRVGVTAAKTLCYASGADLLGLDSLLATGRNAPEQANRISVIADAQRGDLYVADLYRSAPYIPPTPLGDTRVEPLSEWRTRLEPDVFVMGPALEVPRILNQLPKGLLTSGATNNFPDGHHLIALARELWSDGRRDDPWLLEPRYLRRSAAEEQWDRAREPNHS